MVDLINIYHSINNARPNLGFEILGKVILDHVFMTLLLSSFLDINFDE